ncbi:FG-GAP-like repeat-containing protein [Microcystis aeruginosa]|uniref:Ribosome modulation factor n=1 Tax=Microcystis aeruginosa NIES-4285 TaxID=2497681 RepID=A0A402DCW3_MICAE|nr:FG-GAP-like repeat-containing protein [Microcystis aeruginosa]GCE60031.1 ribosome modulation factor [Microcystis aeruginosa NIES-4285]
MADFLDFVVRDSLLNPLNITLLSTDLEQIDQGTRHGIDAQIDDTDTLGRKGAILAESAQENGLKTGNSQSVSLNTSQSLSSLVSSNLQHIAGCNCSFCALPPFDPNLVKNQPKQSAATVSAALNLSQTFSLNSLAGANHTIYLDFNGHTTSGTSWNTSFNKANIVTPAFDFDGNTGSFSNAELEGIQYIWQRVAEDFIPFNVNVTTQAPTDINDLIKSGTGDTRWGVRVAIGGSSYDWYGAGAGGVAYLNSFNWNSDTPTFVFDDQLGNGNEKYTAEAISHEVGHTLGLSHDGRITPSEGYYAGHGSGDTGWAPIMGVGYYQNLSQWSKGEYASANNTQDDLQIITTQNGFGYRTDDTGNTIATAKALTVSGASVSGNGIIERNTDVDFYSFTTGAGAISLTVNPFNRGPNLDILAELYNSAGTLIASSNPTDLLSANITANVAAGTYYLKIDGIGKGNPLTTGYTDYGSLGQYSISGSVSSPSKDIFIRSPQYAGLLTYNGSGFQPNSIQYDWIGGWKLGSGDKHLAGDFDGNGKDDVFIRSPQYAGLLTYNGSGFQTNSIQYDWIGGWKLGSGDQHFVGDFDGNGKDDVFIRSPQYAGLLTYNGSGFQPNSIQYDWIGGWKLGSGDQHFVGDFNNDGKDDVFIRSPQYAGLLTYNGSGFQSNSIQYDWIGGWKLGSGDQHFVGDFA